MRAVIDTSILVRAIIHPTGTVGPILSRLRDGDYILLYSSELLDEIVEVLGRGRLRSKYGITDQDVETPPEAPLSPRRGSRSRAPHPDLPRSKG